MFALEPFLLADYREEITVVCKNIPRLNKAYVARTHPKSAETKKYSECGCTCALLVWQPDRSSAKGPFSHSLFLV